MQQLRRHQRLQLSPEASCPRTVRDGAEVSFPAWTQRVSALRVRELTCSPEPPEVEFLKHV